MRENALDDHVLDEARFAHSACAKDLCHAAHANALHELVLSEALH
jgi:hypothetical protein